MRTVSAPKVVIYVTLYHALGHVNATHLNEIPGVRIFKRSGRGHGVVKLLRNNGEFRDDPQLASRLQVIGLKKDV
jgi:hypothetical protein